MDQESGSGRRRSSRLAAKGVTPTLRSEVMKKTVKSAEKPKRTKRKTTEGVVVLPEAKKTKTEDKKSSKEAKKSDDNTSNNVETNDISGITPMDEDNAETNIMSPSDEEMNDKPLDEEKTDVTDSKVIENITVTTNDEKKEVETPEESDDDKQPDVTEEVITIKDAKIAEQQKNDVPEQVPVVLENTNGKNDDEENDKPVEDAVNNDTGFIVTTKDIVTSNGESDEQVSATNGDESGPESGTNEPIKVLHDDKNHFVETDLKAVTVPGITITNNDDSSVEQVEEELDKVVDNVVDNMNVSADDNEPIVDQSPTVVS